MSYTPIPISVSEFRAKLAEMYKNHLAPNANDPREIWVKDSKSETLLFKVSSFDSKENGFDAYLEELESSKGKVDFNFKKMRLFRKQFRPREL